MQLVQQNEYRNRYVVIKNYADRLGGYVDCWFRISLKDIQIHSSHPEVDGCVCKNEAEVKSLLSQHKWEVA